MTLTTTETLSSANDLLAAHASLIADVRQRQQANRKQLHSLQTVPLDLLRLPFIPSPSPSPQDELPPFSPPLPEEQVAKRKDLPPAKLARMAKYKNYVPEEETIRNDYSQRYVDGGEWPQNWVLGAEPEHRFEEYPKQQRLLALKKAAVNEHSLPPTYLAFSELSSLHPCKFDCILLDPPFSPSFTWEHLQDLPVPSLAADPSFVFLWVGSGTGEGLERGREILAKWGYRRCEDVVWVRSNKTTNKGPGTDPPTTSLFTRTKQHCLMGIRGTVRRSTDSWFVHCNVDTDVIIWEGDPADPTRKPPEMYTLIENFCLGLRRLEVFGRATSSLRRGWLTILDPHQEAILDSMRNRPDGPVHVDGEEGGDAVRWEKETWEGGIKEMAGGGPRLVVPSTPDIDALRPKSPVRNNPGGTSSTHGGVNPSPGPQNQGGVMMPVPMRFGANSPPNVGGMAVPGMVTGPMHAQNQMMGVNPGMMGGMGMNMNVMGGMVGMPVGAVEGMAWPGMMGGGMGMPMMGGVPMGSGIAPGMGQGFPVPGMFNMGMGNVAMWDQSQQQQFQMDGWEGPPMMGMNNMMGGMNMGMGQWNGANGQM